MNIVVCRNIAYGVVSLAGVLGCLWPIIHKSSGLEGFEFYAFQRMGVPRTQFFYFSLSFLVLSQATFHWKLVKIAMKYSYSVMYELSKDGSEACKLPEASSVVRWFFVSLLAVASLSLLFEPVWRTNDDVAMAMIAHGYGLAAEASPAIYFSNVIWGHIVQAIPSVQGVQGYAIATILLTLATAASLLFVASKIGVHPVLAGLTVLIVYVPHVVRPQFTMLAGLCATTGYLWLYYYFYTSSDSLKNIITPILAVFFLALCLIIRKEVFYMISILGMFFIAILICTRKRRDVISVSAKNFFRSQKKIVGGFGILTSFILFVAGSNYYNNFVFSEEQYQNFFDFESVRNNFTDFTFRAYFINHGLEALEEYNLTSTDIELMRNWFFEHVSQDNEKLADVKRLVSEVSIVESLNLSSFHGALAQMFRGDIAFLTLCAFVFVVVLPSRQKWVPIGLLLFFASLMICIGVVMRMPPTRVYVPGLAFICLFSLAMARHTNRLRLIVAGSALLMVLTWQLSYTKIRNTSLIERTEIVQQELSSLDMSELYVVWGANFPYELATPLLRTGPEIHQLRLYPLVSLTLMPYIQARWDREPNSNLLDALLSGRELKFFANDGSLDLLDTYFQQEYGVTCNAQKDHDLTVLSLYHVYCM